MGFKNAHLKNHTCEQTSILVCIDGLLQEDLGMEKLPLEVDDVGERKAAFR